MQNSSSFDFDEKFPSSPEKVNNPNHGQRRESSDGLVVGTVMGIVDDNDDNDIAVASGEIVG